jgi:beta-phosphoglucomutase-like phosphatase (HAD superfamily)
MPAALIFDLDGTLVDTVQTRIGAWLQVFAEVGIETDADRVAPLIGSDGRYLARRVADAAGAPIDDQRAEAIDRRAGEIYERLNLDPQPLPGARELLIRLDERGLPWAIATSSRRQQVAASVAALRLPREPTIVDVATSSRPSRPRICCCLPPASSASSRAGAGTSAIPPGTCSPRWRPA